MEPYGKYPLLFQQENLLLKISFKKVTVVFHEPIKEIKWSKSDSVCEIPFDIPKLPKDFDDVVFENQE